MELSNAEKKALLSIARAKKDKVSISELMSTGMFNTQVELMNALSWLRMKGAIKIEEQIITEYTLSDEGLKLRNTQLPERQVFNIIKSTGTTAINVLLKYLNKKTLSLGIAHLKDLGCDVKNGKIIIPDEKQIEQQLSTRETFLRDFEKMKNNKSLITYFLKRGIIEKKEHVERMVMVTNLVKTELARGLTFKEEISQLTPEHIQTGKWRLLEFRKYDVSMFVPRSNVGRVHPLTEFIQKVRSIFVAMGFEEVDGPYVQSAFWNMDALYIPQDHPARELQDTFYVKFPKYKLPSYKTIVKRVHEQGYGRSIGWGYTWNEELATIPLLRTHSTVNSIQYLYEHHDKKVIKMFSIGRVFRRENMDSTHLPEFTQIEGIMTEKNASFTMLLGVLKTFYRALGIENIKFKPSYFPYTEPSMEVHGLFKNEWLEIGGAGIFRAEVTEPLGITTPVLAWGLGLERLAMLYFGIKDIREIYISDIEHLKTLKLL